MIESVEERKMCVDGTHRTRLPEETLKWIEPVFERVGITRIADVTWLDEIGIPVYQAIRPDSWSLCVSQGKGLTAELAKVSAAMESIELWHAERIQIEQRVASPRELTEELPYRLDELALAPRNAVHTDARLDWSAATIIRTGTRSWLPTELLNQDCRITDRWSIPLFTRWTNGLASGNTLTEAVLHGLYEVIERDAIARAATTGPLPTVALGTVVGPAESLIGQMRHAGVELQVTVLPSPVELPCFRAEIWSDTLPLVFAGTGCHLDRDVALCRALTEAAQTRLTLIAGTRDDILRRNYAHADRAARLRGSGFAEDDGRHRTTYTDVPTTQQPDLAEDLRVTAGHVKAVTGREPLYADHTRPDLGIPVVTVVCPGLRFDPAA